MAIDPADSNDRLLKGARHMADSAPMLLREPIDGGTALAPLRAAAEISEMHRRWADISNSGSEPVADGSVRLLERARRLIRGGRAHASQGNLELTGSLIRAIDSVAQRSDEIVDRLQALEHHLDDVMTVLSEDLQKVRALLEVVGAARQPVQPSPANEPAIDDESP